MKQILNKLLASLDTHTKGYSGRKLTAMWAVLVGTAVTYALPDEAKLHALYSWQLLALLCLGIVTVQNIIQFKNGNNNESKPNTEG